MDLFASLVAMPDSTDDECKMVHTHLKCRDSVVLEWFPEAGPLASGLTSSIRDRWVTATPCVRCSLVSGVESEESEVSEKRTQRARRSGRKDASQ